MDLGFNGISLVPPCRCCRDIAGQYKPTIDGGNYYCYYYIYYYYCYYYYYYYYYCYYYYCRDLMSSTRNPTILYGVQVVQTTLS